MNDIMNKNRTFLWLIVFAALAIPVAIISCDNDDNRYEMPDDVQWRSSGNAAGAIVTTPFDERIEVPARKAGNTFVSHTVQYNGHEVMNYCLEYDPDKMHSRWVAFRFDGDTRPKEVSRSSEPFADDPKLPSSMKIGSGSFGYYSRGHLVASADRLFSREANEQTFYMSNMSPQIFNFNAPYWSKLEGIVQDRGRNTNFADTLYVVKGGYIDDDADIIDYVERGNGKRVAVPGHYFMALLRVKGAADKSSSYNSIAFWIEHRDYGYNDNDVVPASVFQANHQILSVDELESLTGIDFFHNLPDDIEERVEKEYSVGLWMN